MQTPIGPQRTVPSMRREETCDGTAVIVARNLPADKTASELCEFLEESSGLTRLHVSLHARPKTFFEGSTSTLSRLASSEDAAAVRIEHMEGMIRGPAVNARVTPGGWHYEAFAVLEVCNTASCDKISHKTWSGPGAAGCSIRDARFVPRSHLPRLENHAAFR